MASLSRNGHKHESVNNAAVVRYLIASHYHQPNAFGAKVLVLTSLLLANWKTFLSNYHDNIVVDFLTYGWPINYTACTRPVSSSRNHPSALNFDSHMQTYIDTELSYNVIAGPFNYPPFADDFVCSPLQTVPKRGSSTRRVVMDLRFPQGSSVNDGIPSDTYLGDQFKLRLPGIDRLIEFILDKGVTVSFLRKTYAVHIDSFLSIPRTIVYSVFVITENFTLILVVLLVYAHRP